MDIYTTNIRFKVLHLHFEDFNQNHFDYRMVVDAHQALSEDYVKGVALRVLKDKCVVMDKDDYKYLVQHPDSLQANTIIQSYDEVKLHASGGVLKVTGEFEEHGYDTEKHALEQFPDYYVVYNDMCGNTNPRRIEGSYTIELKIVGDIRWLYPRGRYRCE